MLIELFNLILIKNINAYLARKARFKQTQHVQIVLFSVTMSCSIVALEHLSPLQISYMTTAADECVWSLGVLEDYAVALFAHV
jgi:hypothetical protein